MSSPDSNSVSESSFARWRQACDNLLSRQNQPGSSTHSNSLFKSSPIHPISRPSRFPYRSASESQFSQEVWKPDEEESKEDRKRREMCEQWRDELVRTSPMIRFMTKQLSLVSCDPLTPSPSRSNSSPPKLHIATCPPTMAGGFGPSDPGRPTSESGILICSNRVINKGHMEDTLAHEMIHWWDHCRFKVDWNNLKHHACSEIRAASLSGDCRIGREFQRRIYGFSKQHQVCARRRAILSVIDNPACPDKAAAERAVDEVWNSCFNDTRPFDEIY